MPSKQMITCILNNNMIYFPQEGVFDLDMRQEIMAHPVPRERTIRLMDRLLTRGSEAYHQFMDVLKLKYDFVYHEITDIEACKLY